jgi:hypothetical protein
VVENRSDEEVPSDVAKDMAGLSKEGDAPKEETSRL